MLSLCGFDNTGFLVKSEAINIVSNWTKDNNNENYIRNLKRNATTLMINNNLEMIQYKKELMNGNFWGRIFGCFCLNCLVYTFPCRWWAKFIRFALFENFGCANSYFLLSSSSCALLFHPVVAVRIDDI